PLGVARRLGRAVFAALARGVTLGAEAPGVGLAHELARLVPKRGPVDLLDRAARERGRLLDEIEQHALADDRVADPDRALPAEVRASVHRVDPRQAADVAGDDAVEREQDRGRRHAGLEPERIAVADAGRPVAHGVPRGDLDVRRRAPRRHADTL